MFAAKCVVKIFHREGTKARSLPAGLALPKRLPEEVKAYTFPDQSFEVVGA
jgi:hypothetical protein